MVETIQLKHKIYVDWDKNAKSAQIIKTMIQDKCLNGLYWQKDTTKKLFCKWIVFKCLVCVFFGGLCVCLFLFV